MNDTERLDWLADNFGSIGIYAPNPGYPKWAIAIPAENEDGFTMAEAESFRAVIDAAMQGAINE